MVVLAIGHSPALRLDELWVRFGVGTHFRQIAIQEIVKNVTEKCSSILSVSATLCLAASATEKKSAWLAWISCPSAIDAFLDLSLQHVDVSPETLEGIERFLVVVNSRSVQPVEYGKICWHMVLGQWRTSHQPKRHCCNMCDARHSKRGMCGHRRLFRSLSCIVLHFGGGSHLIRGGSPFGLN